MKRAFTLTELLLSVALVVLSSVVFMSVFRSNYQQTQMSRNRAVAAILTRSLLCEIEDHPYGERAPLSWSADEERPVRVVTSGRPVEMLFHKKISFANNSFVTPDSHDNRDAVTIRITWEEDPVQGQPPDSRFKSLETTLPVWRK